MMWPFKRKPREPKPKCDLKPILQSGQPTAMQICVKCGEIYGFSVLGLMTNGNYECVR